MAPSAVVTSVATASATKQPAEHVAAAEHCAEHAALAGGDCGVDDERTASVEQPDHTTAAGEHVGADANALALGESRGAGEGGCAHREDEDLLHDVSPLCCVRDVAHDKTISRVKRRLKLYRKLTLNITVKSSIY